MAALLSSNSGVPEHYYAKRTPLIFTDKNGRKWKEGAYLGQHVVDTVPEYIDLASWYKKRFSFQHILIIAANEKDQKHQYSFHFNCTEAAFLHHIINNLLFVSAIY